MYLMGVCRRLFLSGDIGRQHHLPWRLAGGGHDHGDNQNLLCYGSKVMVIDNSNNIYKKSKKFTALLSACYLFVCAILSDLSFVLSSTSDISTTLLYPFSEREELNAIFNLYLLGISVVFASLTAQLKFMKIVYGFAVMHLSLYAFVAFFATFLSVGDSYIQLDSYFLLVAWFTILIGMSLIMAVRMKLRSQY